MAGLITLQADERVARVNLDNGQLVSLLAGREGFGRREFFHHGGMTGYSGKGWPNSEITPFPIFGPAQDATVRVGKKAYMLEQHGISRHADVIPFYCVA